MRRSLAALAASVLVTALAVAPSTEAQAAYATNDYCLGQCSDILPPGQNGNATLVQILASQAFGTKPAHSDDQLAPYANLAYNYTGERIILVGDRNAPEIIEEDRHRVDLLFKYGFFWNNTELELEAKAANILDEEVEWTQGGQLYEKWDPGITYSIGLRARF